MLRRSYTSPVQLHAYSVDNGDLLGRGRGSSRGGGVGGRARSASPIRSLRRGTSFQHLPSTTPHYGTPDANIYAHHYFQRRSLLSRYPSGSLSASSSPLRSTVSNNSNSLGGGGGGGGRKALGQGRRPPRPSTLPFARTVSADEELGKVSFRTQQLLDIPPYRPRHHQHSNQRRHRSGGSEGRDEDPHNAEHEGAGDGHGHFSDSDEEAGEGEGEYIDSDTGVNPPRGSEKRLPTDRLLRNAASLPNMYKAGSFGSPQQLQSQRRADEKLQRALTSAALLDRQGPRSRSELHPDPPSHSNPHAHTTPPIASSRSAAEQSGHDHPMERYISPIAVEHSSGSGSGSGSSSEIDSGAEDHGGGVHEHNRPPSRSTSHRSNVSASVSVSDRSWTGKGNGRTDDASQFDPFRSIDGVVYVDDDYSSTRTPVPPSHSAHTQHAAHTAHGAAQGSHGAHEVTLSDADDDGDGGGDGVNVDGSSGKGSWHAKAVDVTSDTAYALAGPESPYLRRSRSQHSEHSHRSRSSSRSLSPDRDSRQQSRSRSSSPVHSVGGGERDRVPARSGASLHSVHWKDDAASLASHTSQDSNTSPINQIKRHREASTTSHSSSAPILIPAPAPVSVPSLGAGRGGVTSSGDEYDDMSAITDDASNALLMSPRHHHSLQSPRHGYNTGTGLASSRPQPHQQGIGQGIDQMDVDGAAMMMRPRLMSIDEVLEEEEDEEEDDDMRIVEGAGSAGSQRDSHTGSVERRSGAGSAGACEGAVEGNKQYRVLSSHRSVPHLRSTDFEDQKRNPLPRAASARSLDRGTAAAAAAASAASKKGGEHGLPPTNFTYRHQYGGDNFTLYTSNEGFAQAVLPSPGSTPLSHQVLQILRERRIEPKPYLGSDFMEAFESAVATNPRAVGEGASVGIASSGGERGRADRRRRTGGAGGAGVEEQSSGSTEGHLDKRLLNRYNRLVHDYNELVMQFGRELEVSGTVKAQYKSEIHENVGVNAELERRAQDQAEEIQILREALQKQESYESGQRLHLAHHHQSFATSTSPTSPTSRTSRTSRTLPSSSPISPRRVVKENGSGQRELEAVAQAQRLVETLQEELLTVRGEYEDLLEEREVLRAQLLQEAEKHTYSNSASTTAAAATSTAAGKGGGAAEGMSEVAVRAALDAVEVDVLAYISDSHNSKYTQDTGRRRILFQ